MHFSVPQCTGIWDIHQITSKILWDVYCVIHLLIGCHYCMSVINPPLITVLGLSAPHSRPCLHPRHKLPPFFNTHSFSNMPLSVSLGWCCIIQTMIACHQPAGKDVSWAETLCAGMWCICTKMIAWHLSSPSLLDSYTAADFYDLPFDGGCGLQEPKAKYGKNYVYDFFAPPPFFFSSFQSAPCF